MVRLISEDIVMDGPDGPVLAGARSKQTGRYVFPVPDGSTEDEFEQVALSSKGSLWSYTVQRFPPKKPYIGATPLDQFEPYAIGYVELSGQLIVETRIDTDNFEGLRVGMPMEFTVIEFARNEAGEALHTFAYKPAGNS